ncbi:MAG TPA: vanadium-dependent haloperoxidase [Gemmatimonadaceae bacterium]|nr:vanadium-dependent haloperoxidase [Gemmatimonadaceae bacterium]
MRITTQLFVLPLLFAYPERALLNAQVQPAQAAAESGPTSVRWNRLVPRLVDENTARRRAARSAARAAGDSAALRRIAQSQPPILFRVYSLLSIAQYGAANSAQNNRAVSSDAAVAAASAAVLTQVFTDSAVRASIAGELARDIDRAGTGSGGPAVAIAGKSMGEDVASRVIAWAPPPPSLATPWKGTIPTGPGMWYSAPGIPPIGIFMAQARTWLLDSASQFRPAPPPAFGSPTHKAALEEVRRIARNRTPEQTKLAQLWNDSDPWAPWNATASATILRHHLSDVDAARVFAVLNAAASDAVIACFDAKYHYWSIRPSQADTTIVLADSVDLPNFPSYPSGHACSAGAFDGVLGHFFPQDRAEFTRIAEEQAMSRLYGGIHYRFDDDVGLALGRTVARYDAERERRGALNAWRSAQPAVKR